MTKLGVRYIAVLKLHWRGHGSSDEITANLRMYEDAEHANRSASEWVDPRVTHIRTLAVDLDSLPPADAPEVEQHESQWLYHWIKIQEQRPGTNPDEVIAKEFSRLRQYATAAKAWADNECAMLEGCQGRGRTATHANDCPYGIAERDLYALVKRGELLQTKLAPHPATVNEADVDRVYRALIGTDTGKTARLMTVLRDLEDEGKLWWLRKPHSFVQ